jgi:hypothetical protein
MARAKIRYMGFSPTTTADEAINGRASKGSVASRTFDQGTSDKRPTHKAAGTNAKLNGIMTTSLFDGGDYLDLSTAELFNVGDDWVWIFAFVNLDSTTDCILAYSSDIGGYLGIEAGGNGIIWNPNSSREGESTYATNNTDNSSISYSFGDDVEVLTLVKSSATKLSFYNKDGALIAEDDSSGNGTTWALDRIGANSDTNTEFVGEILDVKLYNSSSETLVQSSAVYQAIGNSYKQSMN